MAASMDENNLQISKAAVDFLNEKFGDDVKSLRNVRDIYNEYKTLKEKLEKQLSLATHDIPNEVDLAVASVETVQCTMTRLGQEKENLHHDVMDNTRHVQSLMTNIQEKTTEIEHLQRYVKYLSAVAKIENYSSRIQTGMLTDSIESSVSSFHKMKELYSTLQTSNCQHLVSFTKETINFWYKILKEKIAIEFEEILKSLGWPFIATSMKAVPSHSAELCNRMELLFTQLLHIQLPDDLTGTGQASPNQTSDPLYFKPLLLPLQLMVKPLRKRFRYHFYGKKQTNSLDKPEWYFSQVLGWIRDHIPFLEQRIQPVLFKAELPAVNVKIEFMSGLVALVTEKMLYDLPEIMYDEHLFSHLVDEAILFDRELRGSYSYPVGFPSCLTVLTKEQAFQKWILVEKQFAGEKMDHMLSSTTAWQSQYKDIADVDEHKVPECGESFVTLMLTITDRYKSLSSAPHKLRFLKLQLHLLEDFRIRLVQVMKEVTHDPLGDQFCAILNAVYYVTEVLQEWCNLPFFLQLQYHHLTAGPDVEINRTHLDSESSFIEELDAVSSQLESSVFEEAIDSFDQLKMEMLKNVVKCINMDVQARSQAYRKDKWIALPSQKTIGGQALSSSACEMLLVLKDHLIHVQNQLSKPLFTSTWQRLAEKLDKFIMDENRFNDDGALQLQFDMTRNLFPLFGEFTLKPENYFREVKEGIVLLTLKPGSAILLKEVLMDDNKKEEEKLGALHEIGIFKTSLIKAGTILDIKILSQM